MTGDRPNEQETGPEIIGSRLTIYHLLPYFLDPHATEAYICRATGLTPEQVAVARAYVLNNPDTVLARHMQIEDRLAAGNPPEVIERASQTHATFQRFKEWLAKRKEADEEQESTTEESEKATTGRLPTFREWLM